MAELFGLIFIVFSFFFGDNSVFSDIIAAIMEIFSGGM
jgi:hypothetical protein